MPSRGDPQTAPADEDVVLRRCKHEIQRLVPGSTIILYGSRSRGRAEPASDYDLLILTDRPTSDLEDRIGDALYDIELQCGAVVSAVVFDRQRWDEPRCRVLPLRQSVDRDGIVV